MSVLNEVNKVILEKSTVSIGLNHDILELSINTLQINANLCASVLIFFQIVLKFRLHNVKFLWSKDWYYWRWKTWKTVSQCAFGFRSV